MALVTFEPWVPRGDDPYLRDLVAELQVEGDLASALAQFPDLDGARALVVLRGLVSRACGASNVANINVGRYGVLQLPRAWVLAHVGEMLETEVAAGEEWELRRALELASLLDAALVRRLIALGTRNTDPSARAAAAEWDER